MNSRIIRNLALIAAMGGGIFMLNAKTAQAQVSCSSCYQQQTQCYVDHCYGLPYCPPQPECQSAFDACIASCEN